MTSKGALREPPHARLIYLAGTVLAEAALLRITDSSVFTVSMDFERAGTLRHDIDLTQRVDAFAARFGRLQDAVGDTLLPLMLAWLSEPVGPAINNLARAERLGWIHSAADWIECRQLRILMIHDYVRDMAVLAATLTRGHLAVPLFETSAQRLAGQVFAAPGSAGSADVA